MTIPPEARRTAMAAIAPHLRGDGRVAQVLLRGTDDLPDLAAELLWIAAHQIGEDSSARLRARHARS